MIKKVFTNAVSQIVGKAFTASSSLLVTLMISRSLGPAGYGDFTKVFVFVGYFYTFVDFGLNAIYIKEAQKNNEYHLLKILVGLRLIIGLIFTILATFIAYWLPYDPVSGTGFSPQVKVAIAIASITILTHALYTTANAFFQKNLRYELSTICAILGAIVVLAVSVLATFTSPSIFIYSLAYVFGGIVTVTAAFFVLVIKTKKIVLPKFNKKLFSELIGKSWPIGLALISNLIYFRNDIFILANARGSDQVGIYGLSYQFFESSLSIPIFFANAIYPVLVNHFQKDRRNFKKQVFFWVKILSFVSLFLVLFLFIVSYLIPIYDSRFNDSKSVLQLLSIGIPFFFISALLWHLLIIYGKQKLLLLIYASGAVINLLLNLTLIPIYGYLAAAATTIFSEALILILLSFALFTITKKAKDTYD